MTGFLNSGSPAPYPGGGIEELTRRLQDLEKRVASMQTLLVNSGSLQVDDPNSGNRVFFVGQIPMGDGSGRMQAAVEIYRQDGTPGIIMFDGGTAPGHTIAQAVQWYDRSENVVFADDTISGQGHARPHLALGCMTNTDTSTWPATSAGTFTTIMSMYSQVQMPKLNWTFLVYAPAAVTGQFRLTVNGTQVGSTFSVTNNNFGTFTDVQPIPPGTSYGNDAFFELQARVSAGTGTVIAQQMEMTNEGS